MPRPTMTTIARLAVTSALLASASACTRPPTKGELDTVQMANDMAEAVNDLRSVNGELRASLDSLTLVVARQDTLLRQIANVTGVQVPPR